MDQGNAGGSQPLRTEQWLAAQVSRPLSKTSILHARQREEQTRQAINEMIVFTEQLLVLPEQVYFAGIADQRADALRDVMTAFVDLANAVWEGLATKSLDRIVLTQEYRQQAVTVSRRITRLQQDAAQTQPAINNRGKVTLKRPLFWTQREQWYRVALIRWRNALGTPNPQGEIVPDAAKVTEAIGPLRASIGAARLNSVYLFLAKSVLLATSVVSVIMMLIFVALASASLFASISDAVRPFGIIAGILLFVWLFVIWLAVLRDDAYFELAGISTWHPFASGETASTVIAKVWLWVSSDLGGAVWLFAIGLLIQNALSQRALFLQTHDLITFLQVVKTSLQPDLIGIFAVSVMYILMCVIPLLVIRQISLLGKLFQNPAIQQSARRSYVLPAISGLIPLLLMAIAGGSYLLTLYRIPQYPFANGFHVSSISVLIILLTIGGYVGTIDLPYRTGIARWRQQTLIELGRQKTEIERRIDRQENSSNTTQDLEIMQMSVARLQFLQLREKDARRTSLSVVPPLLLIIGVVVFVMLVFGIDMLFHVL